MKFKYKAYKQKLHKNSIYNNINTLYTNIIRQKLTKSYFKKYILNTKIKFNHKKLEVFK